MTMWFTLTLSRTELNTVASTRLDVCGYCPLGSFHFGYSDTIGKSGPSVPARPPCGQDGTRPTVANPPATAVAVAAVRALDGRRAGELSAARRAPALTELHRSDLVAAPQLERRRRGMQKTQKWHSQV